MNLIKELLSSKLLMVCLLALNFAFVGCSSSKKSSGSNAAAEEAYAGDNIDESDTSFEINGDSDSGKAGDLRTVFFGFNSSSLNGMAREKLERAAAFLKKNDSTQVQIEGHCDERGGVEYNLALGVRRAEQVKQYLATLGISRSRVSTVSYGKERPVAFGHDEDAWSKNRRANFVIVAK